MSKIINTDEKIILVYNLKGERFKKFKIEADRYNYRIITVEDEETFCKVEDLIFENSDHCINEEATEVDIEFLLFINIVNDDLYGFIADLKKEGLYFPNKAILTETNLQWKLRRLLSENKEEHVIMTMFFNLRHAMRKAQTIVEKENHDDHLLELMERAKHYMNPREFDFDEMKEIHNELAHKVNELYEA